MLNICQISAKIVCCIIFLLRLFWVFLLLLRWVYFFFVLSMLFILYFYDKPETKEWASMAFGAIAVLPTFGLFVFILLYLFDIQLGYKFFAFAICSIVLYALLVRICLAKLDCLNFEKIMLFATLSFMLMCLSYDSGLDRSVLILICNP